jgi:hypothetical protein
MFPASVKNPQSEDDFIFPKVSSSSRAAGPKKDVTVERSPQSLEDEV